MSRYFKGFDPDGKRISIELFDEPEIMIFGLEDDVKRGDKYLVIWKHLDETTIHRAKDFEYLNNEGFHISKEIDKYEYKIYENIRYILNECFMNQFTGGYPKADAIKHHIRYLDRNSRMFLGSVYTESPGEAFINYMANMVKMEVKDGSDE